MRALLLLALAAWQVPALAASYYVDAVAGNDAHPGTSTAQPWRTLARASAQTYAPGDRLLLKRGQSFSNPDTNNPGATTTLLIQGNGQPGQLIVVGAYGNTALPLPRLMNGNLGSLWDTVVDVAGSYVQVRNLAIVEPNPGQATENGVRLRGPYARVTDCDIAGVGIAIKIQSEYAVVTRNLIHDLGMVVNTADGGSDDYGAQGVLVWRDPRVSGSGSHANIHHNTFRNLNAPSHDFGRDGAALEVFNGVSGTRFERNRIENVDNLIEIGGFEHADTVDGLGFVYNLAVGFRGIAYVHNNPAGGSNPSFGVNVRNLRLDNNSFVRNNSEVSGLVIGFDYPLSAVPEIRLRNNIFRLQNISDWGPNHAGLGHGRNLYDLSAAALPAYTLASTELQAAAGFVDEAAGDYHLAPTSPAIDRGAALPYATDIEDLPKSGGALDIGAFEFQQ